MFIETKEMLYEELLDMLKRMNQEDYELNSIIVKTGATLLSQRAGSRAKRAILLKYRYKTLWRLTSEELSETIDILRSVSIYLAAHEYNPDTRRHSFFVKHKKHPYF